MTGQRAHGVAARCLLGVVLTLCTCVERAHAGSGTDDPVVARELFDQGRFLMATGDFETACGKFAESQKLDPGGGTLLNLALCHEQIGKTATAWAEFQEALRVSRQDKRPDREDFANEHIARLTPRLARLTIFVSPAARQQGLLVRRNGTVLPESAWGEPLAVDPGQQRVEVSASGRKTFRVSVPVLGDGERATVLVPRLEEAPSPSPPHAPRRTERSSPPALRATGLIVGGVGLATLLVGGFFGLRAISRSDKANALCRDSDHCSPQGITVSRSAASDAEIATIVTAIGGAVTVGGALTFLLAPGQGTPTKMALGIGASGRF